MIPSDRFNGITVITYISALHAEGHGINPQMNQDFFFYFA